MIKEWLHEINIHTFELKNKLNDLSKQSWEMYKIWKAGYDNYEILAYKNIYSEKEKQFLAIGGIYPKKQNVTGEAEHYEEIK